jgi:hypothetical protein
MIIPALYGAATLGCAALAVIFLRHWRRSSDRLLLMFAGAFLVLAIQYAIIGVTPIGGEWRPYVYAIRLVAFALILFAIIDKNRPSLT